MVSFTIKLFHSHSCGGENESSQAHPNSVDADLTTNPNAKSLLDPVWMTYMGRVRPSYSPPVAPADPALSGAVEDPLCSCRGNPDGGRPPLRGGSGPSVRRGVLRRNTRKRRIEKSSLTNLELSKESGNLGCTCSRRQNCPNGLSQDIDQILDIYPLFFCRKRRQII